jgi:adenine-specific DNA methylase
MVDEEERARVNAFDWKAAFPEVFAQGGFDVVIGNPPYIRIQAMQEWASEQVEYFKQKYKAATKGNYDIYVVFIEKALSLLNSKGKLGFILPHKFFNAQYGEPARELISQGRHISKIVHFGDQQVFDGATTYTCLLFLNKQGQDEFEFTKVSDLENWRDFQTQTSEVFETSEVSGTINAANINSAEWNFSVGKGAELFEKLSQMPVKLGDVAERIFQGFKTGADPVFILEERENGKYYSNALQKEIAIEKTLLRPLYKSGEMKRYGLRKNSRSVIFPYKDGKLLGWNEIISKAPKTSEYLKSCKEILAKRENGRWTGVQWYCYSRNQALEIISSPKILTADLNPFANYCYDESGEACFPGGAAGGYGIVLEKKMYLYVLGLLNSKAVDYYHKKISTNFRGGWFGYDAKIIRNIPIRAINFDDPTEKSAHDKIVSLVESMLAFHKSLASAQSPHEKGRLEKQIKSTDEGIDKLVYELYGLSQEEIKIVEGA